MNRLLCIANWSEGRNLETIALMQTALHSVEQVAVHYEAADYDHNRIVTAFSGKPEDIEKTLFLISEIACQRIDLSTHKGVHPRVGALDVCPFVILQNSMTQLEANEFVTKMARIYAEKYQTPVFLYEKSAPVQHEADLPSLRKGGFEALISKKLNPDFGPAFANPRLGVSIFGLRDWLIAFNINLTSNEPSGAKMIAHKIRQFRKQKNPLFLGVRALGFQLQSRNLSQVSINLSQPDKTSVDPIVDWVEKEAHQIGQLVHSTELIGVIRPSDAAKATRLPITQTQIVEP